MRLGCIADDFTGATDLANNLARGGMRVAQTIGVPPADSHVDADAVVVAMKSRTIEPAAAIAQSLAALQWLRAAGARQIYFKVCSTFDSTDRGNIGPVAEALLDALGADFAPVCPAFPETGRTLYKGYLFVADVPLAESGMRDHPLTPMRDSNLVRVLQRQSRGTVGLVEHAVVAQGPEAIRARIDALGAAGTRMAVVDAIDNADLMAMGRAFCGLPLIVAGSGVAIGLPQNHGLAPNAQATRLPPAHGLRAIVSGSCSAASNAQVAEFRGRGGEALALDPLRIAQGEPVVHEALAWAAARLGEAPILIHATAAPASVQAVQARLGSERAGAIVEEALSAIARGLVERGVRQLIVAGGETSGACVQALGIRELRIGAQIDPGVPWCHAFTPATGSEGLHIALKSGNFGAVDFFTKAFDRLASSPGPGGRSDRKRSARTDLRLRSAQVSTPPEAVAGRPAACVGLVHAVMPAIAPILAAFGRCWPEARTFSLVDDGLPAALEQAGSVTEAITQRIVRLAAHAIASGADGVLFTCSAFGAAIEAAASSRPQPILRPDVAMFDAAMQAGQRIGLLATFEPAVAPTRLDFLARASQRRLAPALEVICVPAAIAAARAGDVSLHDRLVAEAAPRLAHCDAVMLAHFSTSTALERVQALLPCPVFSAPEAAVKAMRLRLEGGA